MKFNDYWKLPKNAKSYFFPKQGEILKEKYGKLYTLHTILSLVIVFIPVIIFFCNIPSNAFEPTTQISNILGGVGFIVGLIGSFFIGLGIVNVFMLFIKQYLGHWITIIAIVAGVILEILSFHIFTFVE